MVGTTWYGRDLYKSCKIILFVVCPFYPHVMNYRSTASGVLTGTGRVASILGNVIFGLLVDTNCAAPMIIVATLLSIGGLSSIKLPNYTGQDLLWSTKSRQSLGVSIKKCIKPVKCSFPVNILFCSLWYIKLYFTLSWHLLIREPRRLPCTCTSHWKPALWPMIACIIMYVCTFDIINSRSLTT